MVPEAAVIHVHPTIVRAPKKPPPSLTSSELLMNQVAELETSWKVITPLELNAPWAKSWLFAVCKNISVVPSGVHSATVDGACAQIFIPIKVTGVDVGTGVEVLELPPQLSSSVVITKASTGATTKHLFCHIKHPAMPWQLQCCQAEPRENEANFTWRIGCE
jgi:hypothetical protein